MKFFQHVVGDFAVATRYMSPEEIGIYVLMRDQYLETEHPLQQEWIDLALVNCNQKSIDRVLAMRFTKDGSQYRNKEFEITLCEYRELSNKKSAGAHNRWNKRLQNVSEYNVSTYSQCRELPKCDNVSTNSQDTTVDFKEKNSETCMSIKNEGQKNGYACINNLEFNKDTYASSVVADDSESVSASPEKKKRATTIIVRPDGVSESDWADYLRLRKEKRMPLTARALKLMTDEGKKAGLTIDRVIVTCLEHSWAGFRADFLENNKKNASKSSNPFLVASRIDQNGATSSRSQFSVDPCPRPKESAPRDVLDDFSELDILDAIDGAIHVQP